MALTRSETAEFISCPKRNAPGSGIQNKFTIGSLGLLPSASASPYLRCPTRLRHVEMIAVDYFIPYYVNDVQSDIRGIKCGWYTMDERGKLGSGLFSSASECLGTSSQPKNAPTPKWLH
jgi:hypothetical protein